MEQKDSYFFTYMTNCSENFHFKFANSGEIRQLAKQKFAESNNNLGFGVKNPNQKHSIDDIAIRIAKARAGFKQSTDEKSIHFSNSEISNFENERFNVINGGFCNQKSNDQAQEDAHEEINENYFEEEDDLAEEDQSELIDEYFQSIASMKNANNSLESILSWYENALNISDSFCQKIESESRFLMKKKAIFNAKNFVSEIENEIENLGIDQDVECIKNDYESLLEFTQNQDESNINEIENLKSDLEIALEVVESGIEKCHEFKDLLSEMIFEIKNLCNESLVNMDKYKESMSKILKFETLRADVENQEIKKILEKRKFCS